METLKNKWHSLPLRHFFILTVLFSVGIVVLISALIIGGCIAFRHWLLPDANAAYLTMEETFSNGDVTESTHLLRFGDDLSSLAFLRAKEDDASNMENVEDVQRIRYSIEKIEAGVDSLTPKRKLAYQLCGIIIFVAPTLLAFAAVICCSMYFYRRKLKQPLAVLTNAAEQIAGQNLDFEIRYSCDDEMGDLCRSFEVMRTELHENYKTMWNMLEERRLMQASVAHDLRNPIAIIKGYAEYLEKGLKKGKMSREKTSHIAQNMGAAAKRLEQYTESVRFLNQSEEIRLTRKPVNASGLTEDIMEDLSLLAEKSGITLKAEKHLSDEEIQVDSALLYRILENIISNALRYAKREIGIDFSLEGAKLFITVTDDGEGFPPEVLNKEGKYLLVADKDGHMGIGLSVSRLLCRKHGGSLELSNTSGGACVKISLSV